MQILEKSGILVLARQLALQDFAQLVALHLAGRRARQLGHGADPSRTFVPRQSQLAGPGGGRSASAASPRAVTNSARRSRPSASGTRTQAASATAGSSAAAASSSPGCTHCPAILTSSSERPWCTKKPSASCTNTSREQNHPSRNCSCVWSDRLVYPLACAGCFTQSTPCRSRRTSTPASGLPVRVPSEVPGGVIMQAQNVSDM